jgi:hypothetical protein
MWGATDTPYPLYTVPNKCRFSTENSISNKDLNILILGQEELELLLGGTWISHECSGFLLFWGGEYLLRIGP